MNFTYTTMVTLFSMLIINWSSHAADVEQTNQANKTGLVNNVGQGPYFGQKPPGLKAQPFAPGIIVTAGFDDGGIFSRDMDEFYIVRRASGSEKVESIVYKKSNNEWHPTVNEGQQYFYPFFSPDGKTMHLGGEFQLRTDSGWSEKKSLGPLFEDIDIMSLSASSQGTYAFDEWTRDGSGILRFSVVVDGKRQAPQVFNKEINSGTWNAHPFLAPDESYVLWNGVKDNGFGKSDLYISFKQKDGSWGMAINMGGSVNTDVYEAGPRVTPDGKYLFFVRNMGSDEFENVDIFWVDAQIIETLRKSSQ